MYKVTLDDLKPRSRNVQFKERIFEKFDSVTSLAEAVGIAPITVQQYLKQSKLGSDTFKHRVSKLFDYEIFDALTSTYEEQLSVLITHICDSVKLYKNDQDLLTQVVQICEEISFTEGLLRMDRCKALMLIYDGKQHEGLELLESTFLKALDANITQLSIQFYCELAFAYYMINRSKEDALSMFARVDPKQALITIDTHFYYQYNYGLVLYYLERYREALAHFRAAAQIKKLRPVLYGRIHLNIGNCLDELKSYDQAEKEYRKALAIFEKAEYENGIGIAYSNLAHIKHMQRNIGDMKIYIDKALDLKDHITDQDYFGVMEEYVNYLNVTKSDLAYPELLEIVTACFNRFVSNFKVLDRLMYLLATSEADFDTLHSFVLKYRQNGGDHAYCERLYGAHFIKANSISILTEI